jgi:hypothetical protein
VVIDFPVLPVQPGVFTSSDDQVCQNESGVAYAVANDVTVSYNWNYSGTGATINGSGNAVTVDFSILATNGTISVTTTNGCGTSSPLTLDVTVNPMPTITLGTDPAVCQGENSASLSYSATTGSPDQYSIVFSAGALAEGFVNVNNASLGASPISFAVPVAAAVNMYNADLTVENSTTGCTSSSYAFTVTINSVPVVNITGSNLECEESTTILDAGAGFSSYAWSIGAINLGNSQTQAITTQSLTSPTNNITETYQVVVTNAEGCSGSDTHDISVYRLPDTGPDYYIPNELNK